MGWKNSPNGGAYLPWTSGQSLQLVDVQASTSYALFSVRTRYGSRMHSSSRNIEKFGSIEKLEA